MPIDSADYDRELDASVVASPKPVPAALPAPLKVESHFWLTTGDQRLLAALSAIALLLMAVHWLKLSRWGNATVEIDRQQPRAYDFRLDINTASWVEWGQLPGVGDTLARRIVTDREQNGPFTGIDDLERVNGIGAKTVERLRPWQLADPTTGAIAPSPSP